MTNQPKFSVDGWTGTYDAVSYGRPWNGWATPLVTRQTLETMFTTEDPDSSWMSVTFDVDGTACVIEQDHTDEDWYEPVLIEPTADGNYDLGMLGWIFETVAESDN